MTKVDYDKKYFTRSKVGYLSYPLYGHKFKNSFFPYITNLWNNLDVSIQVLPLADFKVRLKNELKPPKIKHFAKGSKYGNTLLTRIRLERSDLNLHKFSIGQSDTAECTCEARRESSQHFLMDCSNFTAERRTLFDRVEHFIPTFKNLTKSKKFEILVLGINPTNHEYISTNTAISIAVQKFIFKTNRFTENIV